MKTIQLTPQQRNDISERRRHAQDRRIFQRLSAVLWSDDGRTREEIAELMGRHRSTIYRELDRNAGQRGYRPQQAQRLADQRRLASRRPHKMDDPDVQRYVAGKRDRDERTSA